MQKIVSLFQRNYDGDRLVRDEVVPGAEWVLAGEGIATRKYDGVCAMIRGGRLYKRFELNAKHWTGRSLVPGQWEAADEKDAVTGKQQGWVPVDEANIRSEDRWILEALRNTFGNRQRDGGTYEFVGPKSQGGIEGFDEHCLVRHGADVLPDVPRTFEGLRGYLVDRGIEGIVWHHPDGRMVKIKAKDFGIKRGAASNEGR